MKKARYFLDYYLLRYKKGKKTKFVYYENESDALKDFGKDGLYVTHFYGTQENFYSLMKEYNEGHY